MIACFSAKLKLWSNTNSITRQKIKDIWVYDVIILIEEAECAEIQIDEMSHIHFFYIQYKTKIPAIAGDSRTLAMASDNHQT